MHYTSCCSRNNIPFSSYMSKVEYQPTVPLSLASFSLNHISINTTKVFFHLTQLFIFVFSLKICHKCNLHSYLNMRDRWTNKLFNFHYRATFFATLLHISNQAKKINNFTILPSSVQKERVHFLSIAISSKLEL